MAHAGAVANYAAKFCQGPAGEFLNDLIGTVIPATGGNDFGYVFAWQSTDHIIDSRVRFGAGSIQGQDRLLCGFLVLGEVSFSHTVGAADLTDQAPAIDQGLGRGLWFAAVWLGVVGHCLRR
ncbi:Uncharacterized membrane protein [Pseudomonas syringae pv. actinidiae]|uniref:Uncharacterized membrane protein n=1 Tax=Pseudomonas syringae pv. actinidiae TaxID=103796 RepID=A0A2V0QB11_PSESF|nr:Uncharacterized membrane protein [Pseudomonas syringae pv. actinidiae]